MNMEITLAKKAGFCFGVNRAIEMADQLLAKEEHTVYMLGEIVHNPQIVSSMAKRGAVTIDTIEESCRDGIVFLRSHGVERQEYETLEQFQIAFLDATCPCVAKIHKLVQAAQREKKGVIIIGDEGHPEIMGTASWAQDPVVLKDCDALAEFSNKNPDFFESPSIMVSQTTQKKENWAKCVQFIKKAYTNVTIFDTICYATSERQDEAAALAQASDIMLVVGGKNSSNTKNLAVGCEVFCKRAFHIESAAELSLSMFQKYDKVGITAGASTPAIVIEEVVKKMSDLNNEIMGNDELDFAQELEKSFKTLSTGDRVIGVIAAVYPNEIQVDLGTKQSGYIAFSEFTDDPSEKLEDLVKVGDEVELIVTRVNDVEGMISLSKRRVDAQKTWEEIENGPKENTIFTGKVAEAVRGGLVVNTKGVRVFIPASQVSGNRGGELEDFVGKEVRFKILETDRRRKRAIGSIRAIAKEERAAAEEAFFATAEAGMKYTGTVKSLTSYGAFVDLGGIDGMIHITELSWSRIKHPSEVVNVGDTVDVIINDIDVEKKRISLGYKSLLPNPWDTFVAKYHPGDTVTVKVVKMMPFGAFAEVIKGVDGLIHISQIADHRIAKPQDVLNIDQEVDVKITDIDLEHRKISLSIRALLAADEVSMPAAAPEEVAEPVAEETVEAAAEEIAEPVAEETVEAVAEETAETAE